MEVDPPGSSHGSGLPKVVTEVDPPEVVMQVDRPRSGHRSGPPKLVMEVEPPGSEHRNGPPRSGCRRGGGRGPTEKYCWASGWYALEKRLPCCICIWSEVVNTS